MIKQKKIIKNIKQKKMILNYKTTKRRQKIKYHQQKN